MLCKFHHQMDGETHGHYFHEYRYVPDSCFCIADGMRKSVGQRCYCGNEQYYLDGIVVQALAECFISPRYLEYFSLQAPEGEEGMYLGFSHLHSFLSSIFGFGIAGVLLTKYCPDPALFASREAWEAASMNAHYIWYYFAGIGLVAAVALLIFAKTTEFIDKKKKV